MMSQVSPAEFSGDWCRIILKLSPKQQQFFSRASAEEIFHPLFLSSANWAIQEGYSELIVELRDGRIGAWESFDRKERVEIGVAKILGHRLTAQGDQLRIALAERRSAPSRLKSVSL